MNHLNHILVLVLLTTPVGCARTPPVAKDSVETIPSEDSKSERSVKVGQVWEHPPYLHRMKKTTVKIVKILGGRVTYQYLNSKAQGNCTKELFLKRGKLIGKIMEVNHDD